MLKMITCRQFRNMACMSLLIIALLTITLRQAVAQISSETYIVHTSPPQVWAESADLESWYQSFLPETTYNSDNPDSRIIRTYKNVITGFAARLSSNEVKEMEKKEGFLYAIPERTYTLHTTHSPNFLGLYRNLGSWPRASYGKGVIIGVLDSGITPGHPSFNDEGVPPPPAKWKGQCELNGTACNNKLIGAKNFVSGLSGPPIDDFGHGTHTASTAAGNFVAGANVFGQANGTASGIAPLAHLAIYKVCTETGGCLDSDILAAMDAAIEDGVDILSLSLGGPSLPFYEDNIAIAAFSAVEKGIFVSCSAGNSGPFNSTLSNEAPWILTVGASTIDRSIKATALLGNGFSFDGESLYQPEDFPKTATLPLVYAGAGGTQDAAWCAPGSLNNIDVKGKVVLCERGGGIARLAKGQTVKDAGGAAMILMNEEFDGYSTLADPHVLPATHVSYYAGEQIMEYINSTSSPTATILFQGTKIGKRNAPAVTSFSSRGPNSASPGILKPDIIGPGVSILAAWPISVDNYTDEAGTFNMISGTSMSCPHLSGVAALIKSMYPDWSPAMIKSAIMTTALQINMNNTAILDERNLPADVFAIGAGHVFPPNALNPGLVDNISTREYIDYLCFLYTEDQVSVIARRKISCNGTDGIGVPEAQLNYPSFAIQLGSTSYIYSRTVTNVADGPASYTLRLENVPGVNVTVDPDVLQFNEKNQQLTYKVYVSREDTTTHGAYVEGGITWVSVDTQHFLRIPVSVLLV